MKKKSFIKTISLVLTFALSMQMFSATAQNSITAPEQIVAESQTQNENEFMESSEEPEIVREIVEKREANIKHFEQSDGSTVAVLYSEPVHYMKNGYWRDINNTLIENEEEKTIVNKDGLMDIAFTKDITKENLLTLADEDFIISVGIESSNTTVNPVIQNPVVSDNPMDVSKIRSEITYPEILDNTDLEYILSPNQIKENIIVKERQESYIYQFSLSAEGLIPKAINEQIIGLYDHQALKYQITAPVMTDASGKSSNAVTISLQQNERDEYLLEICADASWINDNGREFPVKIDPTIEVQQSSYGDQYSIISYDPSNTKYYYNSNLKEYKTMIGGYGENNQKAVTFLEFNYLPNIGDSNHITDAKVHLYPADTWDYSEEDNLPAITVHQVTSPLQYTRTDQKNDYGIYTGTTFTWNESPIYSEYPIDSIMATVSNNTSYVAPGGSGPAVSGAVPYTFVITNIVDYWYQTNENYGLAFCNNYNNVITSYWNDKALSLNGWWNLPVLSLTYEPVSEEPEDLLLEDVTLRNEFEKHFYVGETEDGQSEMIAATYAEPVHFQQGEEWVDIDNTLNQVVNENDDLVLENANNPVNVQFAVDSTSEKLVTLQNQGYEVSWSIAGSQTGLINPEEVSPLIQAGDSVPPQNTEEYYTSLGNIVSTVTYPECFSGIDISYSIVSYRIKEDFVMKQVPNMSSFVVNLNCGTLTPTLNEDHSISLNNADGDEIFLFQAPYMYDSAEDTAISHDIDVTITPQSTGYRILITPDRDWLTDPARVYPVTLDPQVSSDRSTSNIDDTYIHVGSYAKQHWGESTMYVGNKNGRTNRAFFRPINLPKISGTITSAQLVLTLHKATNTYKTFAVYRPTKAWSSSSITWANQPGANLVTTGGTVVTNKYPKTYTANVTDLVKGWYSGSYGKYGVEIRYSNESANDFNCFYTCNGTSANDRPVFKINYNSTNNHKTTIALKDYKITATLSEMTPITEYRLEEIEKDNRRFNSYTNQQKIDNHKLIIDAYERFQNIIKGYKVIGASEPYRASMHLLDKNGAYLSIAGSRMIREWDFAKNSLDNELNKVNNAATAFLAQNGESVRFISKTEVANHPSWYQLDTNWAALLGQYGSCIAAKGSKSSGVITLTVDYYIRDFYNFDETQYSWYKYLLRAGWIKPFVVGGIYTTTYKIKE